MIHLATQEKRICSLGVLLCFCLGAQLGCFTLMEKLETINEQNWGTRESACFFSMRTRSHEKPEAEKRKMSNERLLDKG